MGVLHYSQEPIKELQNILEVGKSQDLMNQCAVGTIRKKESEKNLKPISSSKRIVRENQEVYKVNWKEQGAESVITLLRSSTFNIRTMSFPGR